MPGSTHWTRKFRWNSSSPIYIFTTATFNTKHTTKKKKIQYYLVSFTFVTAVLGAECPYHTWCLKLQFYSLWQDELAQHGSVVQMKAVERDSVAAGGSAQRVQSSRSRSTAGKEPGRLGRERKGAAAAARGKTSHRDSNRPQAASTQASSQELASSFRNSTEQHPQAVSAMAPSLPSCHKVPSSITALYSFDWSVAHRLHTHESGKPSRRSSGHTGQA